MPFSTDTPTLVAALVRDLTPVRPLRSPWIRLAGALAATGVLAGAAVALQGRASEWWRALGEPRFTIELGVELVSGVLAALVAFALSVPRAPRTWALRWLPLGAVLAWVLFLTMELARAEWPAITAVLGALRPEACFSTVVAVAALPAALSLVMILRAAPARPAWSAALVVVGAAWVASFATHLHCLNVEPAHGLVSHVAPVFGLAVIGAIAGIVWPRAAAIRFRRRILGKIRSDAR